MRKMTINKISKLNSISIIASIVGLGLFFSSCSKDEISPEVKNSFIQLFGGSYGNEGYDVKLINGSYIIMGTITTKNNGKDIYLAGIDQYGKKLWKKMFGESGDEIGYNMEILSDGRIIIVGSKEVKGKTIVILYTTDASPDGKSDSIPFRDDQEGFNWAGNSVKELENKDLVIVGTASNISNISKGLIIYRKSSGVTISKSYEKGNYVINDVALNDKGYIVTGYETGFQGIYTNKGAEDISLNMFMKSNPKESAPVSLQDDGYTGSDKGIRLLKIGNNSYISLATWTTTDSLKNIQVDWFDYDTNRDSIKITNHKRYGSKEYDEEAADIVATETGYMITGTTKIDDNNTDIFFVSIDKNGGLLLGGPKRFGGSGNQHANAIEATPDGGCVIIGGTGTSTSSKIVVYKLDANGNY